MADNFFERPVIGYNMENNRSTTDEAIKEAKKQDLINSTYQTLLKKQADLYDKLIKDRVEVDQEYIIQAKNLEAKKNKLDDLILELNDLEIALNDYKEELINTHIKEDEVYKSNSKKLDNLSKKVNNMVSWGNSTIVPNNGTFQTHNHLMYSSGSGCN